MAHIFDQYDANWKKLKAADAAAKAAGTLVGRWIAHSYADGKAIYRITKVTARTASIEVVTGIGDDWVLPAWGKKTNIPLKTAKGFIEHQDAMEALVANMQTKFLSK